MQPFKFGRLLINLQPNWHAFCPFTSEVGIKRSFFKWDMRIDKWDMLTAIFPANFCNLKASMNLMCLLFPFVIIFFFFLNIYLHICPLIFVFFKASKMPRESCWHKIYIYIYGPVQVRTILYELNFLTHFGDKFFDEILWISMMCIDYLYQNSSKNSFHKWAKMTGAYRTVRIGTRPYIYIWINKMDK